MRPNQIGQWEATSDARRLNGYERGFRSGLSPIGSNPALSGRTRLSGSDSASLRGCASANRWATALASWAAQAMHTWGG
jgi:hypothetical protein